MRSRGHIRGTLAAAVITALAVTVGITSGCSQPSSPPAPPPTTVAGTTRSAPSPSASPAPTLPDAAKQPTRPAAEEFVRYFFAVYNQAFWSADPTELQAISDTKCIFCNSSIQRVDNVRKNGHHVVGGRIAVSIDVAAPGDSNQGLLVSLVIQQDSGRTVAADGRTVGSTPALTDSRLDVAVRWDDTHWIFLDAHVINKGKS